MSEYEGCSDGGCLLRIKPLGMHTNGGCRCLRDLPKDLQRAIKRKLSVLRDEIAEGREQRDILLEAAKLALREIEWMLSAFPERRGGNYEMVANELRAAIAKAEGKS